ncbi:hypothetical protein ACFFF5_01065 [Lederbergia wuyishanensis]|uniref:Uncharacterized protein n=1 Tax=Lederbergia wuyishanensis TaxID=1347903 RepID=A0ABU0D1D2_9BACI|nr:hypothetical protein [Lederbergia wuyishanensis]MCJ8006832.1 hypothetical protein [Lederbergia wuyishanensis]MDQ0342216.1 hypothetical protein [Lederbergia wuyishanensis]
MIRSIIKMLSALAVLGTAYRFRYKLLNAFLGNSFLRKVSVNAMMNIPGVRSKLMGTAFRK